MGAVHLPEIDKKNSEAYLDDIARTTRGFFLSINQESGAHYADDARHNVVPDLMLGRRSFRRRYRFPWWIKKGFVEELYRIQS